jgi:hypothetical protein
MPAGERKVGVFSQPIDAASYIMLRPDPPKSLRLLSWVCRCYSALI